MLKCRYHANRSHQNECPHCGELNKEQISDSVGVEAKSVSINGIAVGAIYKCLKCGSTVRTIEE